MSIDKEIKNIVERLNPADIDMVIYHHPCPDGFTSATIANTVLKNNKEKTIEYIGMSHPGTVSEELYQKVKNKNLLICDYSFKKPIIQKLIEICKNVLIIDHHVSAQKELQDIDNQYKIFDMEHCGAYLTWQYFYPDKGIPLFVKYIEDNDIWLKKMPQTEEFTSFISILDFEFLEYEKLLFNDIFIYNEAIPMGTILLKQKQKEIVHNLAKSTVKMIEYCGNIYFVGICNATCHISDTGNQMLTKYHHINFSSIYTITGSSYGISLRSNNTSSDVSVIATKCGGGGHRNASGCVLYENPYPGKEIGDYSCFKQLLDVEFVFNQSFIFYEIKETDKEKTMTCEDGTVTNAFYTENYNYVILNTTQNKYKFAKYLLQNRYQDNENRNIQEVCEIYRKQKDDNEIYKQFDFAVTWHYGDKKTWFVLHYSSHREYKIDQLFSKYDDFEWDKTKRFIKFSKITQSQVNL